MSEPSKTEFPDSAVHYARAAVRLGMSIPEIEQHLVLRGLSREEANRLVMNVIEAGVCEASPHIETSNWGKPLRILLCTGIGALCVFLAYWYGGGPSVGRALIWVGPALVSIWIPELTDSSDSDWGIRSLFAGWILLLLCLIYRSILVFLVFWYSWPREN